MATGAESSVRQVPIGELQYSPEGFGSGSCQVKYRITHFVENRSW